MIALLPADRDMRKSERAQLEPGELVVDAFDLLQAEHVRLLGAHEARHEIEPEPDRVDVPGGETEAHIAARIDARGGNDFAIYTSASNASDVNTGVEINLGGVDYTDGVINIMANSAEFTLGGTEYRDRLYNFENAEGGGHGDYLVGSSDVNQLTGNEGDDTLVGLGGNDVLLGGTGDDTLVGLPSPHRKP